MDTQPQGKTGLKPTSRVRINQEISPVSSRKVRNIPSRKVRIRPVLRRGWDIRQKHENVAKECNSVCFATLFPVT